MSTNSSFLSNIFMAAYIEKQSLSKTVFKPTDWKRYIDDIFSLWDISKPDIKSLQMHGTSKLTSPYCSTGYEIYNRNIWHWDNPLRPGWIPRHNIQRKMRKSYIIDVKTHFKRKPSSIYIFTFCHPPIVKMDLTETRSLENPLKKYFRFQKAVDGQRLATKFWKKNCY